MEESSIPGPIFLQKAAFGNWTLWQPPRDATPFGYDGNHPFPPAPREPVPAVPPSQKRRVPLRYGGSGWFPSQPGRRPAEADNLVPKCWNGGFLI